MKTFKDWVRSEKGVDIEEACSDTGCVAGYAQRLDAGEGGLVRRMAPKPIVLGDDLKPKKAKKRKGKKLKVKDMKDDIKGLR